MYTIIISFPVHDVIIFEINVSFVKDENINIKRAKNVFKMK